MTGQEHSEQDAFALKATHDRSRAMTWDHDPDGTKSELENSSHILAVDSAHTLPPLELDPSQYITELVDFDISDEQKAEYLHLIWTIMQSFVTMRLPIEAWETGLDAVICDPESFEGQTEPPAPHGD